MRRAPDITYDTLVNASPLIVVDQYGTFNGAQDKYNWELKGTKKMIQSVKKDKNNPGILIKLPKKKQDLRADLPTIGLDTLKDCKKAGIKGIVLKSKQNIFLDIKKSIEFANKAAAISVTHPGAYHLNQQDIKSIGE